jgi:phage regulator Rha-like protein
MEVDSIKSKIYTLRGVQVMLDRDLAELYEVETGHLNRAVKRNKERFPEGFIFKLTKEEYEKTYSTSLRCQNGILENKPKINSLRSQFVTLNIRKDLRYQNGTLESTRGKHSKYLPYAFTEQGVAMLSATLRSKTAIKTSILIMEAFVAMRHFLLQNANIFQKFQQIDQKLITYDDNFNKIFKAIEDKQITPKQGIFFDGQIFDAYVFVSDLVKSANNSIILIDNFIDDSVLTILSKKKEAVNVTIYTNNISEQLNLDMHKFNRQYKNLELKQFNKAHDRFLIIDSQIYHIGASLKDLGKRWFAFCKLESFDIIQKLKAN